MALHLVVAHQTAASRQLIDRLQDIRAGDAAAGFVLLVPATPLRHLWTWVEGDATVNARRTANEAGAALRRAGLTVVDSVAGPADPLEAIRQEVSRPERQYESIVISMLPPGISRWLRQDLPHQVRAKLGRDVVTVIADPRAAVSQPARPPSSETWEQPTLQALAAMRGSELYCRDGDAGRITEVVYDYATLEPVWLGISSRPLPFRTLLVPAQSVRIESGRVIVPLTREKVLNQPHVDIGEGIPSLTDEHRCYEYFGVPYQEYRDIRVLHAGDRIPGGEQFVQNILGREI